MKVNGNAAAHKPEHERRRRDGSRSPFESAFASQLEQRLPPPPPQPEHRAADDDEARRRQDAVPATRSRGLSVDDLPPRGVMARAANDAADSADSADSAAADSAAAD